MKIQPRPSTKKPLSEEEKEKVAKRFALVLADLKTAATNIEEMSRKLKLASVTIDDKSIAELNEEFKLIGAAIFTLRTGVCRVGADSPRIVDLSQPAPLESDEPDW